MAFVNVVTQKNFTSWYESQALTRAAPTVQADGVSLRDLDAFSVLLENPSGNLSGGGTLQCYIWEPNSNIAIPAGTPTGAWTRYPEGDIPIPSSSNGLARVLFSPKAVSSARGASIFYATSGVTVSAGTAVTVILLGMSNRVKDLY